MVFEVELPERVVAAALSLLLRALALADVSVLHISALVAHLLLLLLQRVVKSSAVIADCSVVAFSPTRCNVISPAVRHPTPLLKPLPGSSATHPAASLTPFALAFHPVAVQKALSQREQYVVML